jgi:two-component system LytT family response regulator/two-component system response regulator LytT
MSISALIIDDEQLAREELKYLLDSVGGVDVVAQGANGIEAVDLIEEHHPDLVFLDVQMPGLDGFAVLQQLRERNRLKAGEKNTEPLPQIVFATAYDQYAVRAFDVNAVDYLLKPFDRGRVVEAVERAKVRMAGGLPSAPDAPNGPEPIGPETGNAQPGSSQPISSQIEALLRLLNRPQAAERASQPAKLIVQAQNRLLLVDQAEICFAAIDEGVIRVVTRVFEGQSKCRTLEELMELLDPARFWRAHRGFVVNIDHIREVIPWFKSSYQLRMNDKQQTEIPVSRAQTRRLKELFNL